MSNKKSISKTTKKHLLFQYRDLLWYFNIDDNEYQKMKDNWGEVDKTDTNGLWNISQSFKDYDSKDFETKIHHGLTHHFYKQGYFEKKENDIFWLGVSCGKKGLDKELHELKEDENLSWVSWGKELKNLTNQSELINHMLGFSDDIEDENKIILSILRNLVNISTLVFNIDSFIGNIKNNWVSGKDKDLLEELLYQSHFHLFFEKEHEKRDDWFPQSKEPLTKLIDGITEKVMEISHSSNYQNQRFLESNWNTSPMKERIKKRTQLKEFLEKTFTKELSGGDNLNNI